MGTCESGVYYITSSARSSTDWRIVSSRVLAVLTLMMNSNLVGCSTGTGTHDHCKYSSVIVPSSFSSTR